MLNERLDRILNLLKIHNKMSVKRLAKELYVCEMTIRRDLKTLEESGYIQRYNGGAMLFAQESQLPMADRQPLHSKEKCRLAKEAVVYAEDYDTVFIDSSSTCMYIIPLLAERKNIKIITNSVHSLILAAKYHIPCIMIGGNCDDRDMCTIGNIATETLQSINVDIAFFSALAYSDDGIISDYNEQQTAVRKTVLKNAKKSIFIFTKTKQHKKSTYTLCTKEEAFKIILE